MKKVKVTIRDQVNGVKYSVYKKFLCFWVKEYGYIPLDSCFFLFDDDLKRLTNQYGDSLIIENKSSIYVQSKNR